jgi:hypothetical protein
MAKSKKSDMMSLIIVFLVVIVFVPLGIKYLNALFGPVVSGFADMAGITLPENLPKPVRYSSTFLPCRSPNPATGATCDEGQFCDGATNTCVNIHPASTGEPDGYYN